MSDFDMNGNVVAQIKSPANQTAVASSLPEITPAPVFRFGPARRNSRGDQNVTRPYWTMGRIYELPNQGRDHTVVSKLNENPKQSGQARHLWTFYGTPTAPKHTVSSLFETIVGENTTVRDPNGIRYTTQRVKDDLLHGLNKGWLRLAPPGEMKIAPTNSRNSYGTLMVGGNVAK